MKRAEVVATNGNDVMTVEEFLNWELDGGRGTYESDLKANDPKWEDLPMEDKVAYMAGSIIDDVLSENWIFETREIPCDKR